MQSKRQVQTEQKPYRDRNRTETATATETPNPFENHFLVTQAHLIYCDNPVGLVEGSNKFLLRFRSLRS